VFHYDIAFITKDFVRSYVRRAQSLDVILTLRCLLLSCFMSGTDTVFLRVMSLCVLLVTCQLVSCALSFFFVYLVYDFNNK